MGGSTMVAIEFEVELLIANATKAHTLRIGFDLTRIVSADFACWQGLCQLRGRANRFASGFASDSHFAGRSPFDSPLLRSGSLRAGSRRTKKSAGSSGRTKTIQSRPREG